MIALLWETISIARGLPLLQVFEAVTRTEQRGSED